MSVEGGTKQKTLERPSGWQRACNVADIATIGDFRVHGGLDKSVIVLHTPDGVQVFYNICRHAGAPIVMGTGNAVSTGLRCPLHGWTWDASGRMPMQAHAPLERDMSLIACRFEVDPSGDIYVNYGQGKPNYNTGA